MADRAADAKAVDKQQLALKRLFTVGSHGMLQKHLLQRLKPINTSKFVAMMRAMEASGWVTSGHSSRHSQRIVTLWNITDTGKVEHLRWIAEQAAQEADIQAALLELQRSAGQC